ncbi:MAG: ABC transporter permease [Ignavibacteriaceae bacterium]|nr:MAG: ABC transporter permease [Ignavibacteriaceae bacterium]MBV6445223.1 putative multidrug ABC transporter permease YbhR [Ignavibacteriaceae bacterium]MBZ0195879.1 ABC transporter permease [Ignavibacteriaceae bacterium]OQY72223.1 MAG: ABC transporter [Ignavibacteriales bacterium UTCHB3]WKZ73502.1 MAG: ABC transporter permease [Ignavibacteriaceae bacterium]
MNTIIRFIIKEFKQFWRDPRMVVMIVVSPMIQLILLGYAATLDINVVHTVVLDNDRSETSRKLIEKFNGSTYFSMDAFYDSYDEVYKAMDNGGVMTALIIPKDFEKDIKRGNTATLQAIFNGSDGNSASISSGYVSKVIINFSEEVVKSKIEMMGIKRIPAGQISAQSRVWYNPGLESKIFMVPAIVGLLLSVVTLILTSLAIVKEREIGTFEQLIVTPIKPWQLIVGKLVPFAILGFIAVLIVLASMNIIFGIAVKGNVTVLLVSSFFYILSTLGLGLLVSTFSKTQQQAMMLAIFVVMLPLIFLSGFAFQVENMPVIFQKISTIVPLKYYLIIVRGVILKGSGFHEHFQDGLALLIIGVVILTISILRFRKRVE